MSCDYICNFTLVSLELCYKCKLIYCIFVKSLRIENLRTIVILSINFKFSCPFVKTQKKPYLMIELYTNV